MFENRDLEVIIVQSIKSAKNRSNCNRLGLAQINSYNRNFNRKIFKTITHLKVSDLKS